jgi:hypothetical protein
MCRVEGCAGPRGSTGLCPEHYAADLAARALERFGPRKRRGWGETPEPRPEPGPRSGAVKATRLCKVDGCEKPGKSRGMCPMHWQRDRVANNPPCEIEGCEKGQLCRGLCGTHYGRLSKGLPPTP